jgi:hypothetical protein
MSEEMNAQNTNQHKLLAMGKKTPQQKGGKKK